MTTSLRPLEARDRDMVLEWRNRPDVSRYMYTDHVIGPAEHATWFAGVLHSTDRGRYWIVQLDGEPVGLANVTHVDARHGRCSWAFYLASPSVRGRGVGSVVEHFVLEFVFEQLHLRKLCCEVLASNQPVIDMHLSFGFVEEGRLRAHVIKEGAPCDVVQLSMLRDEWLAARPKIEARLRAKGLLRPGIQSGPP